MQLKNDDVNTMLMCNDQCTCVGPIELLSTIGRTLDDILNLLQATMTPTHDALLYYNQRWNMPRQKMCRRVVPKVCRVLIRKSQNFGFYTIIIVGSCY